MKKHLRLQRWSILLTVTLIITFFYRDTLGDVLSEIRNLPASMTIISLLFTTVYYIIEGKLIQFVASRHIRRFAWKLGTAIAYISSFYRFITMGAAAGPAEVYYLYQEDIPVSRATGMCLVKYIIHKVTITVYGIVSYLALSKEMKSILMPYRIYILTGSIIMVLFAMILIAVCTSKRFSEFIICLLRRSSVRWNRLKKKIENLVESINLLQEESTVLLTDKKKILWIFVLNLGKQSCFYLIPAILLYHRSEIQVLNVIALMAICNMLAGVLPAPSGIGSLEYVFLQLFRTLTKAQIAASVILLYRFATWMIPFVIGGIFVAFQKRSVKKDTVRKVNFL